MRIRPEKLQIFHVKFAQTVVSRLTTLGSIYLSREVLGVVRHASIYEHV